MSQVNAIDAIRTRAERRDRVWGAILCSVTAIGSLLAIRQILRTADLFTWFALFVCVIGVYAGVKMIRSKQIGFVLGSIVFALLALLLMATFSPILTLIAIAFVFGVGHCIGRARAATRGVQSST